MKYCPICGKELIHRSWFDEFGIEETDERCPRGCYVNNWAYGRTELKLGKWTASFTDHMYIKGNDVAISLRYWYEFHQRLKMIKKRGKHICRR